MKREQVYEKAAQIKHLLDDLWHLDTVQAAPSMIVLAGEVRLPIPDFEVTANGRLLAAGYSGAVIEPAGTVTSPWRVMISVPIPRTAAEGIPWLNIALFCATVLTTYIVGGGEYAFWLLSILVFHEFGHFILARRHKMDASWPYFIPAPPGFVLLGTFGAVIRLRSPIRDKIALFDMAVAGPIAGFVVAVIALAVGLSLSSVAPLEGEGGIYLGESLIFRMLSAIYFPGLADDATIILHPVAFAGWAGLLVTMLNLLPIGQLDGGHIAYAMFGRKQKWIAMVTIALLAGASYYWPGWALWAAIGLLLRPQHPPTLRDDVAIGRTRVVIGWIALAILILCFSPVPLKFAQ